MTLEALRGQVAFNDERVHLARGQTGQIAVAERLRAMLHSEGHSSEIFLKTRHNVQDAYSLRCVPQVCVCVCVFVCVCVCAHACVCGCVVVSVLVFV